MPGLVPEWPILAEQYHQRVSFGGACAPAPAIPSRSPRHFVGDGIDALEFKQFLVYPI
jgi:hypothetical protein